MAKNSGPARIIHERTTGEEREKMIEVTKADIIKKFGDGAIMRYGDGGPELEVEAIPTGAIALDAALGIGGVPRGRIIEIYGPESSGKTTLSLDIVAEAQAMGGVAPSSTPSTPWIPRTPPHRCRYRRGAHLPARYR